jgi:hypothetical protein
MHCYDCRSLIHLNGEATKRHDDLAYVFKRICEGELAMRTEWQQSVRELVSFCSTTNIPSTTLLHQPLPSEAARTRRQAAPSGQRPQRQRPPTTLPIPQDLSAEELLHGPNPLEDEREQGECIGDLTLFSHHFPEPTMMDFKIFSPLGEAEIAWWTRTIVNGTHNFSLNMPVFTRMTYMEQLKVKKYADYIRGLISGPASSSDVFKTAGFQFVPAVMTVFGNLSPSLDALLRIMAETPLTGFDPGLHPVKDSCLLTAEQSTQATLRRFRSLIATAHARALARTIEHRLQATVGKTDQGVAEGGQMGGVRGGRGRRREGETGSPFPLFHFPLS